MLKGSTNRFQGHGDYDYRDEASSGDDFSLEQAGPP